MSLIVEGAAIAATAGLAAGAYAYAANWPTSQLFGRTLITAPCAQPTIALTYDDGPSPRNTPALLDLLAEHQVQATFFLIGEHVRKHPALARQIAAAGHTIGNHTNMHPNLAKRSAAQTKEELTRCQQIIADTTGQQPKLFRPPYGARKPSTLRIARELGLTPVMWNVTAHDWADWPAERILQRIDKGITRNTRKGIASNILLHDASNLDGAEPASREATLHVTQTLLRRKDLRFTTPLAWL